MEYYAVVQIEWKLLFSMYQNGKKSLGYSVKKEADQHIQYASFCIRNEDSKNNYSYLLVIT